MSEEKISSELYKFYVESAEKISGKRSSTNSYMLTVNTFLVSLFGISSNFPVFAQSLWAYCVPAAGSLITLTWYIMIHEYNALNSVKFQVIHEMESNWAYKPFTREWEFAEKGIGKAYKPISKLEPNIPLVFLGLYVIAMIVALFQT